MSDNQLTASYRSPETTKTFVHDLPPLIADSDEPSVKTKTTFLSTLRTKIGEIQSDVNVYLTQKMDDMKAAQAGMGSKALSKEELEEERYGEEDPDVDG